MKNAPDSAAASRPVTWLMKVVICANAGLALVVAWGFWHFGSLSAGLARLRGERLLVDAYSKSFGSLEAGRVGTVKFSLWNTATRPVTVLGARSACSCAAGSDLPMVVPPGARRSVRILLRCNRQPGPVSERVTLLTEEPNQAELGLRVEGVVLPSPASGGPPILSKGM
jgi:hypothetical protein